MTITFGSVCSGIEAASVAWHPLGWRAAWLGEIEPFPAKVLHHHYGSGQPHNMPSPDDAGLSDDDVKDRRASLKAVSGLPLVPLTGDAPPNLGDMTKIAALVRSGAVAAPDVLVGGTPCQAFSIAGLRNSLTDSRGQLSLSFVDLANVIDAARLVCGKPAAVIVWENVPGVLNTKDNAFGCFLAALAGEDEPLQPSGGKWTNAGCVLGPQRTVAWRVLDAQYFGVAQRRRRVFVVASAREGFDPTEVLFEFDGVRRDIAPSREAREGVTVDATRGTAGGSGQPAGRVDLFGGNGDSAGSGLDGRIGSHWDGNYPHPTLNQSNSISGVGQSNQEIFSQRGAYLVPDLAGTVTTTVRRSDQAGSASALLLPITMAHGQGGAEIASDRAPTLTCNHEAPIAVYGIPGNWIGRKPENGGNAVKPMRDVANSMIGAFKGGQGAKAGGIGFDEHVAPKLSAADSGSNRTPVVMHPVAYSFDSAHSNSMKSDNPLSGCRVVEVTKTLDATRPDPSCNHGGIGILHPVSYRTAGDGGVYDSGDKVAALTTGTDPSANIVVFSEQAVAATLEASAGRSRGAGTPVGLLTPVTLIGWTEELTATTDVMGTIQRGGAGGRHDGVMTPSMAVRRLTPRECERLQAFPDDYTLLPGKPLTNVDPGKLDMTYIKYLMRGGVLTFDECINAASDGPRYKALGNSMCVYNMRWIGRRIDAIISPTKE